MFDYKHKIELSTEEEINLFGSDYFADKSTFWKAHQTTLNNLYQRVIATGFPIRITDLETGTALNVQNLNGFHTWLKANQPFTIEQE